MRSDTITKPNW